MSQSGHSAVLSAREGHQVCCEVLVWYILLGVCAITVFHHSITPSLSSITPSLHHCQTSLLHCLPLLHPCHGSFIAYVLLQYSTTVCCYSATVYHNCVTIRHHLITLTLILPSAITHSHHITLPVVPAPALALLATYLRTCLVSWPSCRQRG